MYQRACRVDDALKIGAWARSGQDRALVPILGIVFKLMIKYTSRQVVVIFARPSTQFPR
jgi:hypothetical protein